MNKFYKLLTIAVASLSIGSTQLKASTIQDSTLRIQTESGSCSATVLDNKDGVFTLATAAHCFLTDINNFNSNLIPVKTDSIALTDSKWNIVATKTKSVKLNRKGDAAILEMDIKSWRPTMESATRNEDGKITISGYPNITNTNFYTKEFNNKFSEIKFDSMYMKSFKIDNDEVLHNLSGASGGAISINGHFAGIFTAVNFTTKEGIFTPFTLDDKFLLRENVNVIDTGKDYEQSHPKVSKWVKVAGNWEYFTSQGKLTSSYAKGWTKIKGTWYWFNHNYELWTHKGWEKVKGHWMYSNGSKGYDTAHKYKIGNKYYNFDKNGYWHK